jgi:hypothetical protein
MISLVIGLKVIVNENWNEVVMLVVLIMIIQSHMVQGRLRTLNNSPAFFPTSLNVCVSRLSIPFRFVRNGRNIPCQFKKRNKFHLILNLSPFRIFQLNSAWNVPVSFHMFRSALEKSSNQIEPYSIWLIKPPNYKKLFFIIIFNNNDINNNIENYYYYFH